MRSSIFDNFPGNKTKANRNYPEYEETLCSQLTVSGSCGCISTNTDRVNIVRSIFLI